MQLIFIRAMLCGKMNGVEYPHAINEYHSDFMTPAASVSDFQSVLELLASSCSWRRIFHFFKINSKWILHSSGMSPDRSGINPHCSGINPNTAPGMSPESPGMNPETALGRILTKLQDESWQKFGMNPSSALIQFSDVYFNLFVNVG